MTSKKSKLNKPFCTLVILLVTQLAFSGFIYSQETLPIDDKVRIGKLDNSITYYIRENQKPADRVELRLAVNAGSILENDEQKGLAHFVEHMCFNGTKHFAKNEIIEYLQSIGVKFGPDLNAYTSFDETVYMLTVPSDSADLVNKGFLVLSDWAFNVTFEDEEIDKERGVIIEEWRMGQGAMQRMRDKTLPIIFNGARYAERLPIGEKDVIENFEYETLKSFYKDWYRPDLMAVVVVGDINVDSAEAKIREYFSSYKVAENAKIREEYDIPDHKGTTAVVTTDKESPYTFIQVIQKDDSFEVNTDQEYLDALKYSFISGMLNRRVFELTEKADPPFIGAGFYYSDLYSRNKNGFQSYAIVGETGLERGLQTLLEESKRVAVHGFTQGELDRYYLDFLKGYEEAYNERDKTESASYASEYVRNFLENEAIPGIEYEYALVKENIEKITLDDLNKLVSTLVSSDNRVIVIGGSEKDGLVLPVESEILKIAELVDNTELDAYVDNISSDQLMSVLPEKGSISSEKTIVSIGATEITLSNGAKVLLKPTNFKNDEVKLTAFTYGGTSLYEQEDHISASHTSNIMNQSGVANFSTSDLSKVLAGKSISVQNSIGSYTSGISAESRPDDLESMFQLLYLRFTQPRVDEESFQSYLKKNKDLYHNLSKDPQYYFYDKYNRIYAQDHPRGNYLLSDTDWDKLDFNRVEEIYKDRFADASEYTFIIVGAFDVEQLKPLLERYVASLPSLNRNETYRDLGIRPPKGLVEKNIYKGSDPKSLVILSFDKEIEYKTLDNFLLSQLAAQLNRKYYETLREEMSGIYNIRTTSSLNKIPYGRSNLKIQIPCSPQNTDSLIQAAINEIVNIQNNGVSEEDISKAREIYKRGKEKNLEQNSYWLGMLKKCYLSDLGFDEIESYEELEEINSESLQRVANQYIDTKNYIKVILYPEELE